MSTTKPPGQPNVFTARPKRSRMRRVATPPPVPRRAEEVEDDAPRAAHDEPESAAPREE